MTEAVLEPTVWDVPQPDISHIIEEDYKKNVGDRVSVQFHIPTAVYGYWRLVGCSGGFGVGVWLGLVVGLVVLVL